MHTIKHIKQSILILSFATLVTGCGGGSTGTSGGTAGTSAETTVSISTPTPETTLTPSPQALACKSGPAQQQGQIKDNASGNGVADVTITINGCSTTTDEQGFYTLENIAENEKAIITIESQNSYPHSTMIAVTEYSEGTTKLAGNYLEYILDDYDQQESYNNEMEKLIKTSSNASIKLSASEYIDINTNHYEGTVNANISYHNVSTDIGKTVFPGAFEGQNINGVTVPFVSYGFIAIDLKDSEGGRLDISNDAIITFPSSVESSEDTLPLWYYDYNQGKWIEKGFAQRQTDGSYEGTISHLGTWSLSKPVVVELGVYRARITYDNGNPVKDVRVTLSGKNWVQNDLSTDADGVFEIEVVPDEAFQLEAYNYKWKYSAKYNGTLPAIASGEIVENRI